MNWSSLAVEKLNLRMCSVADKKVSIQEELRQYSTAHNYLAIYFNYVYYLGLSPFRFKLSKSNGYVLHTSKLQKVICGSLQIFTTIYACRNLGFVLSEGTIDVRKRLRQLIPAWSLLTLTMYGPTCAFAMWRSKNHLIKIFDKCQFHLNLRRNASVDLPIEWNWMTTAFVHMFILIYMASAYVSAHVNELVRHCAPPDFELDVLQAQMEFNSTKFDHVELMSSWSIASFLEVIFIVYMVLLGAFIKVSFGVAALVFLHLSNEFSKYLEDVDIETKVVIARYHTTEEIVEYLNRGVSSMTLLQFITSITQYSQLLMHLFTCHSWLNLIETILFGLVVVAVLIAAEANLKMNKMKNWILTRMTDQRNGISCTQIQLQTQYTHVSVEPIALKGGQIFGITYGSVGTGLGLLMTYTIITLQIASSTQSSQN